jgi:hypothetical protein
MNSPIEYLPSGKDKVLFAMRAAADEHGVCRVNQEKMATTLGLQVVDVKHILGMLQADKLLVHLNGNRYRVS